MNTATQPSADRKHTENHFSPPEAPELADPKGALQLSVHPSVSFCPLPRFRRTGPALRVGEPVHGRKDARRSGQPAGREEWVLTLHPALTPGVGRGRDTSRAEDCLPWRCWQTIFRSKALPRATLSAEQAGWLLPPGRVRAQLPTHKARTDCKLARPSPAPAKS